MGLQERQLVRLSIRVVGCAIEVDRHFGRMASNASFSDSFVLFVVKYTAIAPAPIVAGPHAVISGVLHSAG